MIANATTGGASKPTGQIFWGGGGIFWFGNLGHFFWGLCDPIFLHESSSWVE